MTKTIPASAEEYKIALERIWPELPKSYRKMLKAHYLHPQQTMTLKELQEAAGYKSESGVNLQYGKLGKRILKALGDYEPTRRGHDNSPQWTMVIAQGYEGEGIHGGWLWALRSEVSDALDQLGLFPRDTSNNNVLKDLEYFEKEPATKDLKINNRTEYDAIRKSRIGQGLFRKALLEYWDDKCAVTGLSKKRLLRASHIKPWRLSDNRERLDKFNGFLLQPNLDAAFDAYLISFSDEGKIKISKSLTESDLSRLGIHEKMKLSKIEDTHIPYLAHHREMFDKKQS